MGEWEKWKAERGNVSSVADQGCLSRIPEPDFFLSRIADPGSTTKKSRVKINYLFLAFFR
jgi:hypothetical protein